MLTKKKRFMKLFSVLRMIADRLHDLDQTYAKELDRRRQKPSLGQCCNCVYGDFSHLVDNSSLDALGECRRRPPKIVALAGNFGLDGAHPISELPAVDTEDWCGEWVSGL